MNFLPGDLPSFLAPLFAQKAAAVPLAIAVLIAMLALIGVWCQLSLRKRYLKARNLLLKAFAQLSGEIRFEDVQNAVRHEAGPKPRGAGAFLLAYLEHASRRGKEFRPASGVETMAEREGQLRRVAYARWVTGTVLVMGLAGTFLAFTQLVTGSGLMEALGTLRNTPQSQEVSPQLASSYSQLSEAFTRVYQGFGYAFLSSLAGLVGTMALGFVNAFFVVRARGSCLAVMEDFGVEILQPLLTPASRTDDFTAALQSAATVLATSSQAMDSLRETSTVLDRAAGRFEQSQGANSLMVTTLTKLADEIETSRTGWDILLEALRESRTSMGRSVEDFRKEASAQREQSDRAMASAVQGMRDLVAKMAAEIQQVSAAKVEHFAFVQSEVRRMLVDSKKDWEQASAAILAKTDQGFQASLGAVRETIRDGRGDAATALEAMAALTRELSAVVVQHQASLDGHVRAVSASLEQWADAPAALTATVHAGGEALDKLTGTLATVNEMPARWEKRVLGSMAQLESKLDETGARLDRGPAALRWWTGLQRWARGRKP